MDDLWNKKKYLLQDIVAKLKMTTAMETSVLTPASLNHSNPTGSDKAMTTMTINAFAFNAPNAGVGVSVKNKGRTNHTVGVYFKDGEIVSSGANCTTAPVSECVEARTEATGNRTESGSKNAVQLPTVVTSKDALLSTPADCSNRLINSTDTNITATTSIANTKPAPNQQQRHYHQQHDQRQLMTSNSSNNSSNIKIEIESYQNDVERSKVNISQCQSITKQVACSPQSVAMQGPSNNNSHVNADTIMSTSINNTGTTSNMNINDMNAKSQSIVTPPFNLGPDPGDKLSITGTSRSRTFARNRVPASPISSSVLTGLVEDKVRQGYDMNLVPKVKKHLHFLHRWRGATVASASPSSYCTVVSSLPNLVPCDTASYSCDASIDGKSTSSSSENSPCDSEQDMNHSNNKQQRQPQSQQLQPVNKNTAYIPILNAPFGPDAQSCIWVPSSRSDWEDCIDEMVAVCSAAAYHRFRAMRKAKDFTEPISKIYVKERIDIDDPLRGYQIRHSIGGWLQGFVMMTTFTTWTHYFKWDSVHPMNGIGVRKPNVIVDDGRLSEELEGQKRSGDPHGSGVVWPTIAEIGLVGALGCGEYLLQMAIDDIERRGTYEYVVLEATETSKPFYEKFGFIRVGAICKYGDKNELTNDESAVEITGYRHWTYANETKARLDIHGGPSCMMARRVNSRTYQNHKNSLSSQNDQSQCQNCGNLSTTPSFIDEMAQYFVLKKPKIQPLGSTGKKRSRTASSGSLCHMIGEKSVKQAKTSKDATVGSSNAKRTTASGRATKTPTRLEETARPRSHQSVSRSSRNSTKPAPPVLQSINSLYSIKSSSNKPTLRKQKIQNMYRDPRKKYYYNKVVTAKIDKNNNTHKYKSKYYFVLHFEENKKKIRIIPLYLRGTFKGKREGREKWKAIIEPRDGKDENTWLKSMDVITVPTDKWDIVDSFMVTKCASVAEESWDITSKK